MFICNCKYCGKEIEIPDGIVFEGSIADALKHIETLTAEKSSRCECQTLQIGDWVKMKNSIGEYVDFKITDIGTLGDVTYVTGKTKDGGFWCNVLSEVQIIK